MNTATFSESNIQKISRLAKALAIGVLVVGGLFLGTGKALAATPTLSINNAGNNEVTISVNGDSNSTINLYYQNTPGSGSYNSYGSIGTTNGAGYFSNTVSSSQYNVPSGSLVYVLVNNQQSQSIVWPTNNGGSVTLSQTNLYLNAGQSQIVTIYGGTYGDYQVSSNSNGNDISTSISGNSLTVDGIQSGSGTLTVCSIANNNGNTNQCAYLYVQVNGYNGNGNNGNYGSNISFSPTSADVSVNNTQGIAIYGPGNYYISNNPSPSIVSATISGSTLDVTGLQYGTDNLTVCSSNGGTQCTTFYVNVDTNGNSGSNCYSTNGYYNCNNNNDNNNCYYNGSYYNCNNNNNGGTQYVYTTPSNNYYPSGYPSTTYISPTVYATPSPTIVYQQAGTPVSGVYLNQVPATGISFNMKLVIFLLGLALWSAFGAYIYVARSRSKAVVASVQNSTTSMTKSEQYKVEQMKKRGLVK